jgi:integrase
MILRALRAAFERARVTFDLIEKNPLSKVKQIRTPDKRAAYLTVDDIQRLLSSMCREKWLRDIVVFVCNTGLRLGELINLRWENVDLRNKVIRIESDEQYRVKMGKSRIIPLNQKTAYRILKEKSIDKKNSVYVFTSKKGAKVNPFFLSKKFKHYVRLAGLGEEIHFHSLRHTFASLLAQSAVPLYDIKELLGHSQISVTEKYSHLSTESMRRAVEQVPVIKSSPQSIATFLKDAKLKSLREPRSRIDLSKKSSKEKLGQQELTFE